VAGRDNCADDSRDTRGEKQVMQSTMIGKVEKARRYSEETERIVFNEFRVTIIGDHRNHIVSFNDGNWSCDCETMQQHGYCSHTMAMERVLGDMIATATAGGNS
jgi:hypothetical protein